MRDTYPQIERDYIKTGKVKYVIRDLPLEAIHPLAMKAAEATHCSGEQGKYWDMHARLFAHQKELARPALSKHAEALGLDVKAFDQCLDSGKFVERIRKDINEARKLQISGTPTFVVGVSDPKSSEVKGARLSGAQPYTTFKAAIDKALSSEK